MDSSSFRSLWRVTAPSGAVCVSGLALMACTSTPPSMTSGQTTTTYGGTNGSSSSSDDGDPVEETDDGDPGDGDSGDGDSGDGSMDEGGSGHFHDMWGEPGTPDGGTCTSDVECSSGNCYVVQFLGGYCGECNEDADCNDGGCTPPNPFDSIGPVCNDGEAGAGCESDEVCANNLSCSSVLDLLGLIQLNTCGSCQSDLDCGGQICAPLVDIAAWAGQRACIDPHSLPQNSYCELEGNGAQTCASSSCSTVDIMGLAQIGACGECNVDADCDGGVCVPGEFVLDTGLLLGSTCQ